jgi:hypothetical protein
LSSERKLTRSDQLLIHRILIDMVDKLQRSGRKTMFQYLDVTSAMQWLFGCDHAYIVNDAYLVVYDIGEPEYMTPGTKVLAERLVLKLAVSGDFRVVPAFLQRKAREAGCKLVIAGTALAKSDAALASLYQRSGFNTECITITKET